MHCKTSTNEGDKEGIELTVSPHSLVIKDEEEQSDRQWGGEERQTGRESSAPEEKNASALCRPYSLSQFSSSQNSKQLQDRQ